jgi:hypothetical protein
MMGDARDNSYEMKTSSLVNISSRLLLEPNTLVSGALPVMYMDNMS